MAVRVSDRGARRGISAVPIASPALADLPRPRLSARSVTPGASQRFVAAIEQLDCGTPVVSVLGEVDRATAPALEQTLRFAAHAATAEVIVDLSGCSFLDSRGLTALITAWARLDRSNRRLALVLSNPSVMRVFEITAFDELFQIHPTLGAALNGSVDGHA